ncbi:MAG: tetratricopeptide repeat protein [Candidatus Omnitrophica bacterium]|nr:tetratricopeptide repeat protein [Candidatus Omnitrophota bacterium]MDD4981138.1 tetratricopeptide repeat protein [Candidatus Omnitrophota bacterium]
MKKTRLRLFLFSAIALFSLVSAVSLCSPAQASEEKDFEKCACENKDETAANNCLVNIREAYFKENKYSELVDLLRSLCPGNKDIAPSLSYNIALSRYQQLQYLEESKNWDEYFSKGNDYREDIIKEAGKAIEYLPKNSPQLLYSKLLLYKFHKNQQDAFVEEALSSLMSSALEYAGFGKDMAPVKEVADSLLAYEDKSSAKELYKLFAQSLVNSDIKESELKEIAVGFYKEGNLELSENIYDIYIERITKGLPKDKLMQELKEIALLFSYKNSGLHDLLYAERVFKNIEDVLGIASFDEELIYIRAFNLEKNKEYPQARDFYVLLLKNYPKSRYFDEASFKAGVISVYALRDLRVGREYFNQLSDKEQPGIYSLLSLYQLGLLYQWEGQTPSAKDIYNKIIDKAGQEFAEILQSVKDRLSEIEAGASIEYNLKSFIDVALKEEYSNLNMSKVDLNADIYQPKAGEGVSIGASVYLASSGCFNVELQYLWSGDLGGARPGIRDPGVKVSFQNQGTKIIGLVLISPSGITDYTFDLVDVR